MSRLPGVRRPVEPPPVPGQLPPYIIDDVPPAKPFGKKQRDWDRILRMWYHASVATVATIALIWMVVVFFLGLLAFLGAIFMAGAAGAAGARVPRGR